MMVNVYSRIDPKVLLFVINRGEEIGVNRADLSPDDQYLQCAAKKLTKGTTFAPHRHNEMIRTTDITQEAWVFLSGRVAARFWDTDDKLIYETELGAGDAAIVFRGGHSFEVLEENTILYEFKTGPYYGVEKDKTYIQESDA
jgi:cupin fold WbuC family metalloprotein|tara:strand:- start:5039 stop:5464 length:426 start_codon:yes stop_codon:yes gene_type:complete